MGITDSLKEAYYSLEDKYYGFLDRLHGKGVPVYSVVDPIDKVVPSFPLAVLILLLALLFAGLAVSSGGFGLLKILESFLPHAFSAKIIAADGFGNLIENANVKVAGEGLGVEKKTDAWGEAPFDLPAESVMAQVDVSAEGFDAFSSQLELKSGEASRIVLSYSGGDGNANFQAAEKTVVVINAKTKKILNDRSVMAELRCSTGQKKFEISGNPNSDKTIFSNGSFSVNVERDCGTLLASFTANGFESRSSVPISNDTTNVELSPIADLPQEKGSVEVTVFDFNGAALQGAQTVLLDSHNSVADSLETDASGKAFFDGVKPGRHTVRAIALDGRSKSAAVDVAADETVSVSIKFDAPVAGGKKIFLRVVDSQTGEALSGVSITVFDTNSETSEIAFFNSYNSDRNGVLERYVENGAFLAIFSLSEYVTKFVPNLPLKNRNDAQAEEISLEPSTERNSGSLRVSVLNQENLQPVSGTKIFLYNSTYQGAAANSPYSLTDNDGNVLFEGLPAGTYKVEAEKDDFNGVAENIPVAIGVEAHEQILLVIGSGSVKAAVTDWESGEPLENVSVSFFNALSENNETLAQKQTDAKGEAAQSFRSDAVVYLRAEKEGYISASTLNIDVTQNQERKSDIRLMANDIAGNAEILANFSGVFEDQQLSKKAHSLEPNHYYFVKFEVSLPQNKPYSSLVSHVRVGPDSAQSIPENGYVTRISSATVSSGGQATLAKCFNPDNVFIEPQNCVVQSNAKQANAYWPNPENRTTYTEAVKIFVEPTAVAGTKIEFHWQAKARVLDSDVLTEALSREFGVSETICTPGKDCPPIIWHFWLQKQGSADRTPLDNFKQSDRLPVDIFSENFLYAEALNSSGRDYDKLDISVASKDPDNAIVFPDKGNASQAKILENASFAPNSRKTSIGAGAEITPLKFKPNAETANAKLVVSVQSQALPISDAEQTLFFQILSDKEMQFSRLPQNVFPGIDNQQVSGQITDKADGAPIKNASVKMLVDEREPVVSTTDDAGWFSFRISPAAENSVKFTAIKPGYKPAESSEIPVSYSNAFDPQYGCITISRRSLDMAPEQEESFVVSAENCHEPASIDIISNLDVQPKSFDLDSSGEETVSVLADNPSGGEEVYLGQYPVFVRAKFNGDTTFIPIGQVLALISDNSNSCFGIDRTSFDFAEQGTQNAVISRNCPAGFVDAFRPEAGIDSSRVSLGQNPGPPSGISFKWQATATGTENYFEASNQQSVANGWKDFYMTANQEFSQVNVNVGLDNVSEMKFDAYSFDQGACPDSSNLGAATNIKVNGVPAQADCTIGAGGTAIVSPHCNWAVEECLDGEQATQKCPFGRPCKHVSVPVVLPTGTRRVDTITASIYNNDGLNWLFFSVKADIPETQIRVEKKTEARHMETPEQTVTISNPKKGVKYSLGPVSLDLFKHPEYKGGYYSGTTIEAHATTNADKTRVWIEGNNAFAEVLGEPVSTGNTFNVSLSNISLSETAYALISVEDFTSQVRDHDR